MILYQPAPLPQICTIDEMRAFLSSSAEQDALVLSLMASGTAWIENYTCSQFGLRTAAIYMGAFPGQEIDLGVKQVASVIDIDYSDEDNAPQTLANTDFNSDAPIGRYIWPLDGESWPATNNNRNNIAVNITLGSADIPPDVKLAQQLFCAQAWDDIDNDAAIKSQLAPYVWRY